MLHLNPHDYLIAIPVIADTVAIRIHPGVLCSTLLLSRQAMLVCTQVMLHITGWMCSRDQVSDKVTCADYVHSTTCLSGMHFFASSVIKCHPLTQLGTIFLQGQPGDAKGAGHA